MNASYWLIAAIAFGVVFAFACLLLAMARREANKLAARVPEVSEDE